MFIIIAGELKWSQSDDCRRLKKLFFWLFKWPDEYRVKRKMLYEENK